MRRNCKAPPASRTEPKPRRSVAYSSDTANDVIVPSMHIQLAERKGVLVHFCVIHESVEVAPALGTTCTGTGPSRAAYPRSVPRTGSREWERPTEIGEKRGTRPTPTLRGKRFPRRVGAHAKTLDYLMSICISLVPKGRNRLFLPPSHSPRRRAPPSPPRARMSVWEGAALHIIIRMANTNNSSS